MVSPYYEDDLVTLYHGDCLTETAWLAADVLVTDPPYGMGYTGFGGRRGEPRRSTGALEVVGDTDTTVRDSALALWGTRPALVFGRWTVQRPAAARHLLIWDKSDNGPGMGALDLPWGPSFEEVYVLGAGFAGKREGSIIKAKGWTSGDAGRPNHPTPKPTNLLEVLIAKCPAGVVADPFAGSGATLLAAKLAGRRAVGVELEERYCEVIASRLAQDAFDFGESA